MYTTNWDPAMIPCVWSMSLSIIIPCSIFSEVRSELDDLIDVKNVLGVRAPQLSIGGNDEFIGTSHSKDVSKLSIPKV